MNAEAPVTPRKNPKQQRSIWLVGSVIEATARILERYGYAQISTNRVADLAGVSVGSLYQYFPGKEALVAAVLERQVLKAMDQFEAGLKAYAHLPPAEEIKFLVASTVGFYADNRLISRELFLHSRQERQMQFVLSVRRRAVNLVADILIERKLSREPQKTAYVVVNTIMGVVMTSLVDGESPLDRESAIAELTNLVRGYLKV